MTERLPDVIGHINQSSMSLSAAAEETSAISVHTSTNLALQQQGTDQVAAAINEMAATVQEVSQNTSLAASSANSANKAADHGRAAVQTISDMNIQIATTIEEQAAVTAADVCSL